MPDRPITVLKHTVINRDSVSKLLQRYNSARGQENGVVAEIFTYLHASIEKHEDVEKRLAKLEAKT